MQDRHFFTDTSTATLEYAGDGDITVDGFDPSNAETVTLDTPWSEFFDTSEFVQFNATVAQPIVQPYVYNGRLVKFKKDEQELKQAQPQIDNLPWTMGHPENNRVTTADEIRGFWSDPRWNDGQQATVNIPANDTEAIRFAVENDEVSVGFNGDIEWMEDDDVGHDGVQRSMAYDHIASVENGRCPPEKGCGLHADGVDSDGTHGHMTDGFVATVQTQETDEPDDSDDWSVGDWVTFTTNGERHHGRLSYVDSERALVKKYDTDEETLSDDATTVATASLKNWVGPYADSCPGDTCTCGCHLHTDTETTMTNLEELLADNDITAEQVLDHFADSRGESAAESAFADAFDIEQKQDPTEFYDGEPDEEDLADDFDAVETLVDERDLLKDEKESLEAEVEDLNDSLSKYQRGEYEEKVDTLTDMTDKWSEDELMEKFDEDEWTADDVDEKIELVEDIKGDTTTVGDSKDEEGSEEDTITDSGLETTSSGKVDLRSATK